MISIWRTGPITLMPTPQSIRTLVDQFVSDLSAVVHQQALDTVRAALGGGAASKRRGPGRPGGSGKRGPGRPPKSASRRGPGRPPKAAGRIRLSAADLEATSAKVLAYVRANAGQRLEEIGRGLRTATAGLKRPIQVLVADGKLRTEGQKRGTKYFAGSRGGSKRGAGKKAKRRVARKARKTGRRRVAKRAKRKARRAPARRRVTKARGRRRAARKAPRRVRKPAQTPARRKITKKVRRVVRKIRKALEPKPAKTKAPPEVPLMPEPGTIL